LTATGWHFLPGDKRLRWGTKEVVKVGKTLEVEGPPVLCGHGFHASRRAIDALGYCPNTDKIFVSRVRLSGVIIESNDKMVATKRSALSIADATRTLHEFACWCAEGALRSEEKAGRAVDPRSWGAVETKRLWLDGKATKKQLAAARAATWDAARAAAWAATWDAAWAATRDAAWDAARAAAWAAARDAAWAAARAAAWDAARGDGNR
jgi:hypothetical protein